MNDAVREYMAEIGRRGGRKSKRKLTSEQARELAQKKINKQHTADGPLGGTLSPRCLSCDSFDRDKLDCAAESCPYAAE